MKFATFFLFLMSSVVFSQQVPEPANLGQLKKAIRQYIDSGSYLGDQKAVYEQVKAFIEANKVEGTRYAVVMDIDETTLSNVAYEKLYGFGYSRATWSEWVNSKKAVAIPPAKEFYDWGRSQGLTFFFVTGRKQYGESLEQDPTVQNLVAAGFPEFGKVFLKPRQKGLTTIAYKSGARKQVEQLGYTIIANIGDQVSDLSGGHAMSVWKLPNPMYWVD